MSLPNDKIDAVAEHQSMELESASDRLYTGSPTGEHPPEPTAIVHTEPSDTRVSTDDEAQEPAATNNQPTVQEPVVDDPHKNTSAGEDPPSLTKADENHQHAGTKLSIENQEPLAGTPEILHGVDPEGDVILDLDDGISIRVASAVLRLSSKYFKTRLFEPFGEGQGERSTTKPQRLPLEGWNLDVVHRLFCLLHHQPDLEAALDLCQLDDAALGEEVECAARRLRDLALVAEYLQCSHTLSRISDSLFNDFALPRVRDVIPFQATVDLVATAYVMENPRYFRLFTKRLVTDHTESSEDAELPVGIPDSIMPELADQSMYAWRALKTAMYGLARFECTAAHSRCDDATDSLIVQNLTAHLLPSGTPWPELPSEVISLRHLLVGIYNLDRIPRAGWCAAHKARTHDVIGHVAFRQLCEDIDDGYAVGLCRRCVGVPRCRCWKSDLSLSEKRWVSGDSFMSGTGR
jgi:hypothetical protein